MSSRRLIVGITGASGAAYGIRALELAQAAGVETHLVVSRSALLTLNQELGLQKADLAGQADMIYPVADIGASIASGSFPTIGPESQQALAHAFLQFPSAVGSVDLA